LISVGDLDPYPDLMDPHDFGPAGSVSISQRYESRSGSGSFPFSHKCVEQTEIMPAKYNFDAKLYQVTVKEKNMEKNCLASLKSMKEGVGSGVVRKFYGWIQNDQ